MSSRSASATSSSSNASDITMDLSKSGFKCPNTRVLAANVVDTDGKLWAYALVGKDFTTGECETSLDCRGKDPTQIDCDSMGIASVRNIPPELTTLFLDYNELTELNLTAHSGHTQLKEVTLGHNLITSMDDIVLPSSVEYLSLIHNSLTTLSFSNALSNLAKLEVSYNPITRVDVQGIGVADLAATHVHLKSLSDLRLPPSIATLDVSYNPNMTFHNFTAPQDMVTFLAQNSNITTLRSLDFSTAESLRSLALDGNTIREIAGMAFPPQLEQLLLNGSVVTCFIVRESDLSTLGKLQTFNVSSLTQKNCSKADATGVSKRDITIRGVKYPFSVLDDASFESRFFPGRAATSSPSSSTSPPSSSSSSSSSPSRTLAPASSTGSQQTPVVIASTVVVLLVILAAIVWAVYYHRRRRFDHSSSSATATATATTTTTTAVTSSGSLLTEDIRDDPVLACTRIAQSDLSKSQLLGQGAFGVVYLATFRPTKTHVILKQILPEKAKEPAMIQQFMAEIRLCAKLHHPKIVQFVGISWSTLADLAVILEYMPNGDLATVLHQELKNPHNRQRFSWSSSSSMIQRNKLELALDLAEALVYLHSFFPPIIHRDLKANNVLLSHDWVAKLADFGISRQVGTQMTAEVGTVAWTAPEVFRNGKYTQAADVYSFGVVLSELDTCEKPFAHGIVLPGGGEVLTEPSNGRIALAVSESGARPAFHADCPHEILAIAHNCLHTEPTKRPTALALFHSLKKLLDDSGKPAVAKMTSVSL